MNHAPEGELTSIILPVYNAGIRLVDALVSAMSQTHARLEIICVNDGSTDDSLAIMQALAEEDERIRIIDAPNAGYGAAMNRGLGAAQGEWVAILEPDDWISPTMLERMLAFASSLPCKPDVVKCPFWWVPSDDEFGDHEIHCTYKGLIHPKGQPFGLDEAPELFAHHPSIWSALYRKSYLDAHKIRFPEYPGSGWADNRFLAETLLKTDKIAYLDEPFYHYRAGTPEREAAFLKANPALPFERWMDITRILEAQNVTDAGIRRAHARHGFTYLAQVMKAGALDDPNTVKAVHVMFNHMDEDAVMDDAAVPPAQRTLFAQMRGMECIRSNRAAHAVYLMKEGLRRVRVNGIHATLADIRRIFSH